MTMGQGKESKLNSGTNNALGARMMIISAFSFAIMSVFVKKAGALPSMEKSLFRNAISLIFAASIIIRDKVDLRIPKKDVPVMAVRAIAGTLSVLANFYAVDHMPIGDANTLGKLSPFISVVFSYILLKEAFEGYQMAAMLIAFGGAVLILKPSFAGDPIPGLVALANSFFAGLAYTMVRKLGKDGVNKSVTVFYFSLGSIIMLLPGAIVKFVPMTRTQLLWMLAAGLAASFGQISLTSGYTYAPASNISVFAYSQIVFAALFGWIFFGEIPGLTSVIGSAIVIIAAVWVWKRNKK